MKCKNEILLLLYLGLIGRRRMSGSAPASTSAEPPRRTPNPDADRHHRPPFRSRPTARGNTNADQLCQSAGSHHRHQHRRRWTVLSERRRYRPRLPRRRHIANRDHRSGLQGLRRALARVAAGHLRARGELPYYESCSRAERLEVPVKTPSAGCYPMRVDTIKGAFLGRLQLPLYHLLAAAGKPTRCRSAWRRGR
jgi:hypothetical protein